MHKICTIGVFLLISACGVSPVLEDELTPSWLFVQTSAKYDFDGTILSIPYERQIFGFTDRPYRLHTHMDANVFVALWSEDEGNFKQEPPNAVLTWFNEGTVGEAEIVIIDATFDPIGQNILYQLSSDFDSNIDDEGNNVSLFIDSIHMSFFENSAPQLSGSVGLSCEISGTC